MSILEQYNDEARKEEARKQRVRDVAIEAERAELRERTIAAREARRDYFAAAALQGLLASRGPGMDLQLSDPVNAASWAVAHADALIAELDKAATKDPS